MLLRECRGKPLASARKAETGGYNTMAEQNEIAARHHLVIAPGRDAGNFSLAVRINILLCCGLLRSE
jgi:hypothetical protein